MFYVCVIWYDFYHYEGGKGYLDIQPHWVTALTWPLSKGMFDGQLGLSTDVLLVGRLDGSLASIQTLDSSSYRRQELEHCYRRNGMQPCT